ncbi:hypothetical protein [Streptomyces nigrescens]|uniref:hypothetical protein n=1 Tax=Streptomyces nigrescens TaxID=1920 RepID=UPI0036FCDA9A
MTSHRPLANGASTDHPLPGLPFVEDAHLGPGLLQPHAAAAGGQTAVRRTLTQDPVRGDLVWIVHSRPGHGQSVMLCEVETRGADPADIGEEPPLAVRAGGYWWDGVSWYRPAQLWDATAGSFERHPVPAAATVTAADLLCDPTIDADHGQLHTVASLTNAAPTSSNWLNDLARWATHRTQEPNRPSLKRCMVNLTAPELAADQLVNTPTLAAIASITPSTLRAYISRCNGGVPHPQATIGGRPMWSLPVAQAWATQRRRPAPDVRAVKPADRAGELSPGDNDLWRRLDQLFFAALWGHPAHRTRWVLRHRTPDAVHEVAADLAHLAVTRLHDTVPMQALAEVLTHAVLVDPAAPTGPSSSAGQVLDWLTRHDPRLAEQTLTTITQQSLAAHRPNAEQQLGSTGAGEER